MSRSLAPWALILVVAQACGDADAATGKWTGSTRDSAGITIIDNPEVGTWTPGNGWTVEPVVTIGAAEGEEYLQFGQIIGMSLANNGDINVLDFQAGEIRSFTSTGEYLRTTGRKGNGPGEIAMGVGVFQGIGDTLIVPDMGARRVSRFPADGNDAVSFPLDLTMGIPARWETSDQGQLVAQLRPFSGGGGAPVALGSHDIIAIASADGFDTLMTIPAGETVQFQSDIPRFHIFAPEPMWTLGQGLEVFVARNDQVRIDKYVNGELASIILRAVERQEVTERDERRVRSAVERALSQQGQIPAPMLERILSTMTVADYFPTLLQLQGGPDGTLWVQRFTRFSELSGEEEEAFNPLDIGSRWWEVFDAEGRMLGEVEMPDKFQPLGFTDSQVYGIWRDELDVQYAMVATITKP